MPKALNPRALNPKDILGVFRVFGSGFGYELGFGLRVGFPLTPVAQATRSMKTPF